MHVFVGQDDVGEQRDVSSLDKRNNWSVLL